MSVRNLLVQWAENALRSIHGDPYEFDPVKYNKFISTLAKAEDLWKDMVLDNEKIASEQTMAPRVRKVMDLIRDGEEGKPKIINELRVLAAAIRDNQLHPNTVQTMLPRRIEEIADIFQEALSS